MDQAEILDGFLAQHLKDPDSTGMVQHEGDYEAHEDEEKKEDLDLTGEHAVEFLPQPRSTVEAWKETIQRSDAEVVIVSITVDSTAASHAHLNHQELVLTLASETETMLQACIESDSVQKVVALSNSHAMQSHEGDLTTQLWIQKLEQSISQQDAATPTNIPRSVCENFAEREAWKVANRLAQTSDKISLLHPTPCLIGPVMTDDIGKASSNFLNLSRQLLSQIKNAASFSTSWMRAIAQLPVAKP